MDVENEADDDDEVDEEPVPSLGGESGCVERYATRCMVCGWGRFVVVVAIMARTVEV